MRLGRAQCLAVVAASLAICATEATFEIENDVFKLDGESLQIISGSVHYWRIPHQYWKDRLIRLKRMGLNTVQTYIPWNMHELAPKQYKFDGDLNVFKFLDVIKEVGLHANLRPGPYICAEHDAGGLPWWLGSELVEGGRTMRLRQNDKWFLHYATSWWDALLPQIKPYMHHEGGPILMVQIENEYGFCGSNKEYLRALLANAKRNLGDAALIFTTDPPWIVHQGSLEGDEVYTVVDFGPQTDAEAAFKIQKSMNPPGKTAPFCSEFYTGWLTHWGQAMANTSAQDMTEAFTKILKYGNGTGSVNLYMAHGGTNFGFWAGAGIDGDTFLPQITSYDYGAPLSEQGRKGQPGIGGPNKYEMLQDAISEHTGQPKQDWPIEIPTKAFGTIDMEQGLSLIDVADFAPGKVETQLPKSMEQLGQGSGAILYETHIKADSLQNEAELDFGGAVHDYAHVYLDDKLVDYLDRSRPRSVMLPATTKADSSFLRILVHAMGKDSGGCAFDFKGLVNPVKLNGTVLEQSWTTWLLQDFSQMSRFAVREHPRNFTESDVLPRFFIGVLHIEESSRLESGHFPDTFLNLTGWGKGVALVNGFNLGWYWPSIGPQNHYYVPGPRLQKGKNEIILIEAESVPDHPQVSFVEEPDLRGPKGYMPPRPGDGFNKETNGAHHVMSVAEYAGRIQ